MKCSAFFKTQNKSHFLWVLFINSRQKLVLCSYFKDYALLKMAILWVVTPCRY